VSRPPHETSETAWLRNEVERLRAALEEAESRARGAQRKLSEVQNNSKKKDAEVATLSGNLTIESEHCHRYKAELEEARSYLTGDALAAYEARQAQEVK